MKVVIAEKPQLGRDIAKAIGIVSSSDGYIQCQGDTTVTWCIGHILDQAPPQAYNEKYAQWRFEDLPMQLRPLRMQVKESTKKQFEVVQKLLEDATEVIHAGDADDEGQLLVDEVIEYCGFKGTVKRLIVNDLNVESVKKALKNLQPNENFKGMSNKALARTQADYIYGLNLTRAYTLCARNRGHDSVFSVGRVQTPTLGLIVRRYLENKNHKGFFYYLIDGQFDFSGENFFRLNIDEALAGNPDKKILDEAKAKAIQEECANKPAKVIEHSIKEEKKSAPLPFSLLDLQAAMNAKYGYSAQETLDITQSLREKHKAITYNRSDCRYLTSEQLADAPKTIEFIYSVLPEKKHDCIDVKAPSRAFNDSKVTAHTGIIPVASNFQISDLAEKERNVYDAIVAQYLVQFCPAKTYNRCKVSIECAGYTFTSSATETLNKGWSVLIEDKDSEEEEGSTEEASYEVLASLNEGTNGECNKVRITAQKTKPLPIYTEGSLLKDLRSVAKYVADPEIKALLIKKDEGKEGENGGIGTPATRSAIIENLHKKGYTEYQGKKIIPTEKGIEFIRVLPEIITRPDITALWFQEQQDIEAGTKSVDAFLDGIDQFVAKEVSSARDAKIQEKETVSCPECKTGIMKVRKSANGSFLACSNYPQCKYTESLLAEKPIPPCPCCGSKLNANSKAISCTNCDLTIWRTVASLYLKDNQILDLITKGRTRPISGFKSRAGKDFEASLLVDKNKRAVAFDFTSSRS